MLYRSDRLELDTFSPTVGGNQQSQSLVVDPATGETTFALTPGLIDPTNAAWTDSRKPISASFIVKGSTSARKRLHVIAAVRPVPPLCVSWKLTICLQHFASKSGSGPTMGRIQPGENGGPSPVSFSPAPHLTRPLPRKSGAVEARIAQAHVVAGFVSDLLARDPDAHVRPPTPFVPRIYLS